MKRGLRQSTGRLLQRGAASLIVVMLLFFVLSLTAAYTSRNLIFEQKTSANQSRSTAAFEAAEAGIEWTLAMLNGGTVSNACANLAGGTSFQQRYVAIAPYGAAPPTPPGLVAPPAPASGRIYQRVRDAVPHSELHDMWPTCVFNGTNWDCSCPEAASATPVSVPVGQGPFPAFRVWPATPEPTLNPPAPPSNAASSPWGQVTHNREGFMFLNSLGCTRLPAAGETCLDYIARGEIGEGLSFQRTTLALRSGLAVSPAAAVTARVTVTPAGGPALPLKVINTDGRSGGTSIHSAVAVTDKALFDVQTLPGTPPDSSFVAGDTRLVDLNNNVAPATVPPVPAALTNGERMFVSTFGMKRGTYRNQPGLRECASPCSAASVNTLLQNNPDRVIWVQGDLVVDADIGTPDVTPVLLIVNGDTLTMNPDRIIYGFVYLTGDGALTPDTSTIVIVGGSPQIQGAIVAEGNLITTATSGQLTVKYDAAALDRLRRTYGSWVRLGAAWRDFKVVP